jgi:hypothetical protein
MTQYLGQEDAMRYNRMSSQAILVLAISLTWSSFGFCESLLVIKPSVVEILGHLVQKDGKPMFFDCENTEHDPSGYKVVDTAARCGGGHLYADTIVGKPLIAGDGVAIGAVTGVAFGENKKIDTVYWYSKDEGKQFHVMYNTLSPTIEGGNVYTKLQKSELKSEQK